MKSPQQRTERSQSTYLQKPRFGLRKIQVRLDQGLDQKNKSPIVVGFVFLLAAVWVSIATNDAQAQLKIYYLRHAEGGHHVQQNWGGVPEDQGPAYVESANAFTPAGKAELAVVADKLKKNQSFDFVASSPSWRARNPVLPYLKERGINGGIWPELDEIYNSHLALSPDLTTPVEKNLGAGEPVKLPAEEATFFSIRTGGENAFRPPRFPQVHTDREGEAAVARLIQQRVIQMIRQRFAGSDKSVFLSGHGSSGKGLLRMLTQDQQTECREGISNSGLWMVEEQPNGEFKPMIYNDAPVENGKPISTTVSSDGFEPDKLVTYKVIDGVELKLHCFEPQGHQLSDQAPAIVFFFGGGWSGGDPKQFYEQARGLAELGMVAMSAEYRVKSRNKTTPFECVKDGKSAIRWVRQNAEQLGIDPNRIVASGGSAGGHIAACTGMIQGLEEAGEDLSISSAPNAMILFNPVLDTTAKGYGLSKVGKARQTEISPCHHVRQGMVPTLLFHGTADTTVPFENANRFAKLMNEAGNCCQLEAFNGKGHGFFNGIFFRPKTKDLSDYRRTKSEVKAFLTLHGYLK